MLIYIYIYIFYCYCKVVSFSSVFNNCTVTNIIMIITTIPTQNKSRGCIAINLCKIYVKSMNAIYCDSYFYFISFLLFLHHQINYLFNAHKNVVIFFFTFHFTFSSLTQNVIHKSHNYVNCIILMIIYHFIVLYLEENNKKLWWFMIIIVVGKLVVLMVFKV